MQSAALVSLAHREMLRMAHVAAPFVRVTAQVQVASSTSGFRAGVVSVGDQPLATAKDFGPDGQLKAESSALVLSAEQGEQVVAFLKARGATVTAVTRAPYSSRPPAPFITSTLQQAASANLHLDPKVTMKIAQHLYDQGLITYMRTDSPSLSDEAVAAARAIATGKFGASSVPGEARIYGSRNKNAHEAHEAIRPSGSAFRSSGQTALTGQELAVYDLIFRRTVASQMMDLRGEKTTLILKSGNVGLESSGRVVQEPGFTRLYLDAREDADDAGEQALPTVQVGEELNISTASAELTKTPAPGRFTQARLVQALEKAGVGRPSTYAAILDTLTARGYARMVNRQLVVTWLGLVVAAYLQEQFGAFVGVTFTARMEADLDRIAAGELRREEYLTDIWLGHLAPLIGKAAHQAPAVAIPRVPGAVVSAQSEQVVLRMNGKAVPLPPDLAPDALTPELATKLMSGLPVTRPPRPKKGQKAKRKTEKNAGKGDATPSKHGSPDP